MTEVIQVRGTSGSGKSTVMRRVMDRLGPWQPVYVPGRKRPLYYLDPARGVAVLGHYESPCGGCDTVGSAAAVYDLTVSLTAVPGLGLRFVLQEGLLLSEDVRWSSRLQALTVYYLDTPLERCLTQIQGRRAAAGNDKPLNPDNTANRVAVIERSRVKLASLGKRCVVCSPAVCVGFVVGRLGQAGQAGGGGSLCPTIPQTTRS